MTYGYYDDAACEFVVARPDTPSPWINYLGSDSFFTLISNTSGGYSFYKDARMLRLTRYRYNNVPGDSGGQYFYVRDSENLWTPGWMPVKAQMEEYSCRHGLGYTRIEGVKDRLRVTQTSMVPRGVNALVTRVALSNESDAAKDVSLFSFVEFCLWNAQDDSTNFQRNFSTGEVEIEGSAIYHKTEYRERRNHFAVYWVNAPVEGFDTDRESFLGAYRGFDCPAAVDEDRSRNSVASGWSPVGSHHLRVHLEAGERKAFVFLLGYCENPEDQKFISPGVINKAPAYRLFDAFSDEERFDAALKELKEYWKELLSNFRIQSPDEKLDRSVNLWNQYQCMVTFNMSRSASYYESGIGRGMGFRDSTQDLLGFVHMIPSRARERILDIAATQFPDGSAYHQYQPLTKRGNYDVGSGFNDDPLWLIAGVAAYVKETGDAGILSEQVPFDNDGSKAASLLEHLKRSWHYTLDHLGPHRLPLIGRADWNDCLNLNCFSKTSGESFQTTANFESGIAESVFIAAMFCYVAPDYQALLRIAGDADEAERVTEERAAMEKAILSAGWDGEWFLRAYDAYGQKIGSAECEEGKIYIEPQGFAVMAGVGIESGEAQKAMDSVEKHLLSKYGIAILTPPYTRYHTELGEISSYPPGYKENGGIFCHNNPWVILAMTKLGHGGKAFDLYRRICPAYIEDQKLHRTEPYVYSQMVAGPAAPRFGEAKNSWLTGTSAWSFYAVSQGILGIRPDYEGLRIDPCLPGQIGEVRVNRRFRAAQYSIHIVNRSGDEKGRTRMLVDGVPAEGNLIAYDGKDHAVEVIIE
ncbi:MAG: glycosyl transferase [Clostridia bacterium]|nr:glycosyl transferase [Clostridia bacterium]